MHTESPTLPAALAAALRTDPNGPLLTYYDEATGERTELSATTLENWVAKTANLLLDGCGLTADDTAAALLPAHWQTAAVLLGCLRAGVPVRTGGDDGPVEVAFAALDRHDEAAARRPADTFLFALAPMAAPVRDLPPDTADYVVEVRGFGDRFGGPAPDPAAVATLTPAPVSHAELMARALGYGADAGLLPGGRLLVPVDAEPDPVAWLYAPLAAGASVVLVRHASEERLAAIAAAERVTVRT